MPEYEIVGGPKTTSFCAVEIGDFALLGGTVYLRLAPFHPMKADGKVGEKVNAICVSTGRLTFVPWQSEVQTMFATFTVRPEKIK
jgi:hypothetical protein